MIDFGLSEDYLSGYTARLKGEPFDVNKSDDWKMGWTNAHQALHYKWVFEIKEECDLNELVGKERKYCKHYGHQIKYYVYDEELCENREPI